MVSQIILIRCERIAKEEESRRLNKQLNVFRILLINLLKITSFYASICFASDASLLDNTLWKGMRRYIFLLLIQTNQIVGMGSFVGCNFVLRKLLLLFERFWTDFASIRFCSVIFPEVSLQFSIFSKSRNTLIACKGLFTWNFWVI